MVSYYKNSEREGNVGVVTLRQAHHKITKICGASDVLQLQEEKLRYEKYPNVQKQRASGFNRGYGCNFILQDDEKVYFFSRVLGAKTSNIDAPGCW
jgi:hypothetical protein